MFRFVSTAHRTLSSSSAFRRKIAAGLVTVLASASLPAQAQNANTQPLSDRSTGTNTSPSVSRPEPMIQPRTPTTTMPSAQPSAPRQPTLAPNYTDQQGGHVQGPEKGSRSGVH